MSIDANQPDIDFLPARYREQTVRRRLNVWRLAVVVTCGGLVSVGALHQWTVRWALERELAVIQQRYEAQKERILLLNTLDDGLKKAQSQARLLAFLSHPWPRTRILAAVLEPLPVEVRLKELRIVREIVERAGPPAPPAPPVDPAAPVEKPLAEAADLAALHKECNSTEVVVLIEGEAATADILQRFLAAVAESPLLKSAELQSLSSDEEGRTHFKVRIEVAPGIGQPGGPETQREELAATPEAKP